MLLGQRRVAKTEATQMRAAVKKCAPHEEGKKMGERLPNMPLTDLRSRKASYRECGVDRIKDPARHQQNDVPLNHHLPVSPLTKRPTDFENCGTGIKLMTARNRRPVPTPTRKRNP